MPHSSPRVELPYLQPSQAQKDITHNEALQRLDAVTQLCLQGFADTVPPELPAPGDIHGVGSNPTGAWAGHSHQLAYWSGDQWLFLTPQDGWRAWGVGEQALRVWRDGQWQSAFSWLDNMERLGVNTTADATNRLAVASVATLLSHDGSGHQLKVNKAATGDTASLLFQSNWTGHAEMGLAGTNDWSIKVSSDGNSWTEALVLDNVTGLASGASVQSSPTDATAGRLLTVGASATVLSASPALRATYGGTADAIILTSGASLSSVPTGFAVRFRATSTNTGATTINMDGTGAVAARTITGVALPAGYIRTDADTVITYDGTNWIVDRQIERGSNANGVYVRYADGTQICYGGIISSESAEVIWTYPAAFTSTPRVQITPLLGSARIGTTTNRLVASTGVNVFDLTGARDARSVDLVAVGYIF